MRQPCRTGWISPCSWAWTCRGLPIKLHENPRPCANKLMPVCARNLPNRGFLLLWCTATVQPAPRQHDRPSRTMPDSLGQDPLKKALPGNGIVKSAATAVASKVSSLPCSKILHQIKPPLPINGRWMVHRPSRPPVEKFVPRPPGRIGTERHKIHTRLQYRLARPEYFGPPACPTQTAFC